MTAATTCTATLGGFPGGLVCVAIGTHAGHSFESTSCGDAEVGCDE